MNEEFKNFVLNEIISKYEDEKMLLVGVNSNLCENGKRIVILAVVKIMPIVLSDLFVGTLYAFDTTTLKPYTELNRLKFTKFREDRGSKFKGFSIVYAKYAKTKILFNVKQMVNYEEFANNCRNKEIKLDSLLHNK